MEEKKKREEKDKEKEDTISNYSDDINNGIFSVFISINR